jgi:hypothetical protein
MRALASLAQLTHLSLGHACIDADAIAAEARHLSQLTTLRELSLEDNTLWRADSDSASDPDCSSGLDRAARETVSEADMVEVFGGAVATSKRLRCLNLDSKNPNLYNYGSRLPARSSVMQLSEWLQPLSCLSVLTLHCAGCSEAEARALFPGVRLRAG